MTILEFISLAKECKTKAELAALANSNGLAFNADAINKLFQKIKDGAELSDDTLESAAGGSSIYGQNLDKFLS